MKTDCLAYTKETNNIYPQTEIISQFLMEVNLERGFLFRPEGRFVPYAVPTLYYRFVSESG